MIRGIIETSFLDWDGQIVMVMYTAPCNFRCPFCHNWELIENPEKYPEKKWASIKKYLEKHFDFIDGVCITGGEPTLEPGLEDLCRKIKKMKLGVKLDTNGTRPDVLKKLIEKGLVDYIAMDVKMPPDGDYSRAVGVNADTEKIRESIELIMKSGIDYEFRTTVVPGIHGKEDILAIAKYLKGARKYVLQQFNPYHAWDEAMRDVKPYDKEIILEMAEDCRDYFETVGVRGLR